MLRPWLASIVPLLIVGCDAGDCVATGSNSVKATLNGTADIGGRVTRVGERRSADDAQQCIALVRGRLDDGAGTANIQLDCFDERWSGRSAVIDLPDPRSLTGTSTTRLTIRRSAGATEDISATIEVVEAAGAPAALPQAVTDDFVRRLRITASIDETAVTLDVAFTAADLRSPDRTCPG
ncbi:MAG: hypothetical protein KF795_32520 [Labilithrix sp.]|nr:hypothetical protein [Labilithrix sp.]